MMASLSLVDLAHKYGGVLWQLSGEPKISSVATDSRTVGAGDCFVAIRGDRFDAHEFVDDVIARQAGSLVVEAPQRKNLPQWVVSDSVKALGQISHENRSFFKGPLIAITGSNGKTTVKEMLASILVQSGQVLATQGNLNNHIGVPLTLMDLSPKHDYAVIEMGASALGEIAYLCELAEPDVAVINNVGEAHIEKFGSAENILKAKGEIYAGIKQGGTAVVNLDSRGAAGYISSLENCSVISFSLESPEADVRATDIQLDERESAAGNAESSYSRFVLWINEQSKPVSLSVPARHNISNALAAAACAHTAGISLEQIVRGLESFGGVKGRLQFLDGPNGSQLIDDSYNASPASVRAAIEFLSSRQGERVLVLGDMGELGKDAERFHIEIGEYARESGIEILAATGPLSRKAVESFGSAARWFEPQAELIDFLREQASEGVTMLMKGSRSSAMENVVEALRKVTGEA